MASFINLRGHRSAILFLTETARSLGVDGDGVPDMV